MELIVKWKIAAGQTENVLKLLTEMSEKTKAETGNELYEIYRSQNDPNELFLHERYSSENAAEAHKNSEHYQSIVVAQILPHLEIREVNVVKKVN